MTKVRLMAADASPLLTDLFYMVIDPATSPADRKVEGTSIASLLAAAPAFTTVYGRLAVDNHFTGGQGFGTTAPTERNPFITTYTIDAADGVAGDNFIGGVLQAVFTGDFTSAPSPDPGYVFGFNLFATTGTGAADATGSTAMIGTLAEMSIRSGAGANFFWVTGLLAEAAFMGATAGAHVEQMHSLYVTKPKRKGGATAGTADTIYGCFIDAVTVGDLGSTSAYSLWVDGGKSGIRGKLELFQTPGGGMPPMIVRDVALTGRIAEIDENGVVFGFQHRTLNSLAWMLESSAGGVVQLDYSTSAQSSPGAGKAKLFLRAGTTGGTLKLCVQAGATGAQQTILDNIPQ